MDKSLDELVEQNRSTRGRGRGGSRGRGGRGGNGNTSSGRGGGPMRRGGRGGQRKQGPYSRPGAADVDRWSHDLFQEDVTRAPARTNPDSTRYGTKVRVSNLRFDVLEDSLEELFSTCGTIHSVKVFYDKSGRSEGKGEVIYKLNGDAERAVREYNGTSIDGQAMNVDIVGQVPIRNRGETRGVNTGSGKGGMRSDSAEFNAINSARGKQQQSEKNEMDLEDPDLTNLKIRVSF